MKDLQAPRPALQIAFYKRLQDLRDTYLLDALLEVVAESEVARIDRELSDFVPSTDLQRLASWGLRGELVFPVPYLLRQSPWLLGYYRLLLGFSQKAFYGKDVGLGTFRAMEASGELSSRNEKLLDSLCTALCTSASELLNGIGQLSRPVIHDLTLLTLGPQLRGGALNAIGNRATKLVFDLVRSIVEPALTQQEERFLLLRNAAMRSVKVAFASDPDISIQEVLPSGKSHNLVAIEIKGGKDWSNIHNRIGEAEKSHQKARQEGYVECWTLVGVANLDLEIAKRESPTTDRFFHIDKVLEESSVERRDFSEHLRARVGISD